MAGQHIPDNDFIMQGRYKVVTLCGSTRFKDDFFRVQKELTLEGNIVISVGLFGHSGDDEVWTAGTKEMLDDMHFSKIDMADEIFVVNPGGYVGESTARDWLCIELRKTCALTLPSTSGEVCCKRTHKCYARCRIRKWNLQMLSGSE